MEALEVIVKYSVIIPVYNAEKTLDRCLMSLVSQDYPDAEIILVNDGSTDDSEKICQSYADRFTQIRYIRKENGGVSTARNAGLDAAVGTYVLFVDSDDYVESDYFEYLDSISPDHEYVIFSFSMRDGDYRRDRILEPYTSSDAQEYYSKLSRLLYQKNINFPWNKRYLRDIIEQNKIRFHRNLSIGEDALFNLQYALHCSSCKVSDSALYIVNTDNKQSLSRKIRSDIHEQIALCEQEMLLAIQTAKLDVPYSKLLLDALNFLHMREIYAESKRMHKRGFSIWARLKEIDRLCVCFNQSKASVPRDRYCRLLLLPVRFRLAILIDLAGWKLAH